jgi:TonB-dependent Receptor Plug Domain
LGLYVFEALVPGTYEVRCELPGFKKFVSTGNTLTIGQQAELNIRLDPGELTDTVNITETIAPVQTTDSQVRTLITGTVIREMPLNGRNPLHLVLSGVPGVSGRGTGIYVNGQKTQSNNTTLDGISVDDPTLGRAELSLVFINPDMLQEYQVVTSNFKPEYGRGTGAQVSLVTRSGSNEFHGSVYEFHRNTVFNANDFFNNANGVERPNLLRHQFGGAIGGPIKRNRAFFFFNYDAQRQSRTVPQNRTVFTEEARRGIFR